MELIQRFCKNCKTQLVPKIHPRSVERADIFSERQYCNHACHHKERGDEVKRNFWNRLEKLDNGCWEYTGSRNKKNYGRIRLYNKEIGTHRLAYMIHHNLEYLASTIFICHHCDNPPCCNPEHLFAGRATDNTQDAYNKGRIKSHNRWTKRHLHIGESNW